MDATQPPGRASRTISAATSPGPGTLTSSVRACTRSTNPAAARFAWHPQSRSAPRSAPARRRTRRPSRHAPGPRPGPQPGPPARPAAPAGPECRAGRSPDRSRPVLAAGQPGPADPGCRRPAHQPDAAAGRSHPRCCPARRRRSDPDPVPCPTGAGQNRPCCTTPRPGSLGNTLHHIPGVTAGDAAAHLGECGSAHPCLASQGAGVACPGAER